MVIMRNVKEMDIVQPVYQYLVQSKLGEIVNGKSIPQFFGRSLAVSRFGSYALVAFLMHSQAALLSAEVVAASASTYVSALYQFYLDCNKQELESIYLLADVKGSNFRLSDMEMKVQGGGGGGEVRRLHIIYFLSRMGRVEQPHLIRIHHLAPNGVYLRDVKQWLSDLRGKELAESFAWSYKRRYKAGYLWQDLLDDDLITPISDNEFVLKGSEIPSSDGDKKQDQDSENGQKCCPHKSDVLRLRKTSPPSPEIIEESIQFESESSSASMEYSLKQDGKGVAKDAKDTNREMGEEDSCHTSFLNKQPTKKMGASLVAVSQHASNGKSNKSQSTVSSILRNLTTCCAVDTDDSVTVPAHHPIKKSSLNDLGSEVCKWNADKLGGSARISRALSNHYQQQHQPARNSCDGGRGSRKKVDKGEFSCLKSVPVSYPTCSQCGKAFKPEKLHSHMKSCRGMKMFAKNAAASTSAARDIGRSSTSSDRETDRSSLLCH